MGSTGMTETVSQEIIKKRFGQRVWLCVGCRQVMGVFKENFLDLDIDTRHVDMTLSGGAIVRRCQRCKTENKIRTRKEGESVEQWVAAHDNQLAEFRNKTSE